MIATGVGIQQALQQSNQDLENPLTCRQINRLVSQMNAREKITFFVATNDQAVIPEASETRLIGELSVDEFGQETYTIGVDGCPHTFSYTSTQSDTIGPFTLRMFTTHPYFVRAWRDYAQDSDSAVFWGSLGTVKNRCAQSPLTPGQCMQMLNSISNSWRTGPDTFCVNGRTYGPGIGGLLDDRSPAVCTPMFSHDWYPRSDLGTGNKLHTARMHDISLDGSIDLDLFSENTGGGGGL